MKINLYHKDGRNNFPACSSRICVSVNLVPVCLLWSAGNIETKYLFTKKQMGKKFWLGYGLACMIEYIILLIQKSSSPFCFLQNIQHHSFYVLMTSMFGDRVDGFSFLGGAGKQHASLFAPSKYVCLNLH